ncbi:MAG: TIGR02452 family protein [Oscillospiraceae bacterium]|nr:TIGR02452 family protein [Oscillospiraceae bacterium]
MNNIKVAKETIRITAEGKYTLSGNTVDLPQKDYKEVIVYSPEAGAALPDIKKDGELCRITVINADSFQAARGFDDPFVMNFANAHCPGGGFMLGANAQEEALCRCSTLYASISSEKAAEMYRYNNSHISMTESDYMLLSPNVCVFRNEKCELLEMPFSAAVITIPAPNRYGAAMLASGKLIAETMTRRMRIMLKIAAKNGYKNLILGAWGCGAFGNDPSDVAGHFRTVLIDEGYGYGFDNVCFAVYGREDGRNISAFRRIFKDSL